MNGVKQLQHNHCIADGRTDLQFEIVRQQDTRDVIRNTTQLTQVFLIFVSVWKVQGISYGLISYVWIIWYEFGMYTEPNKDIPRYYIEYYKMSFPEEEIWGIQNAVMDLTSYNQLDKDWGFSQM